MKVYFLKQGKEVINKVNTDSIEFAIEYFANIKQMSKKDLLEIYNVTDK